MKRRHFITATSLSIPAMALNVSGCKRTEIQNQSDPLIDKAVQAMLCMQRMAWEQGTASQALIAAGRKDLAILFAKDALVRQTKEGRLGILGNDPGVTDPASNGESILLAYKETGDERFNTAAQAMYKYLKSDAPRTKEGILHHVTYAKQVWSDAAFMAPPFLGLMGDYDEAVKQIDGFRKYLLDPDKKLYYHQWDEDKNEFSRKKFWGGGNGWTAAAIAKILRGLPSERNDLRAKLITWGKEVIDGSLAYMRSDGLFHDIIDDSNSFVETNLGQMLAFSIYTGYQSGWLDETYLKKANIMRNAAKKKIDSYGIVQGACSSPSFDKPGTSTEAQAFFIMMENAALSLH